VVLGFGHPEAGGLKGSRAGGGGWVPCPPTHKRSLIIITAFQDQSAFAVSEFPLTEGGGPQRFSFLFVASCVW
jgi:hypothetical protein